MIGSHDEKGRSMMPRAVDGKMQRHATVAGNAGRWGPSAEAVRRPGAYARRGRLALSRRGSGKQCLTPVGRQDRTGTSTPTAAGCARDIQVSMPSGLESGERQMVRWQRPAFSLAEMMIALAILAMGLLVIGIALPVGAKFQSESINLATADAAADYAESVIRGRMCIPRDLYEGGELVAFSPIFVPRDDGEGGGFGSGGDRGLFDPTYEPLIKVRALWTQNAVATPGGTFGYHDQGNTFYVGPLAPVLPEARVDWWITNMAGFGQPGPKESGARQFYQSSPWIWWSLPSVAMVYPPVEPDTRRLATNYFDAFQDSGMYTRRPVTDTGSGVVGAETLKALDRRVNWTAFYRRVSYRTGSDPTYYEFIIVVTRRPSARHQFPVQDVTASAALGAKSSSGSQGSQIPDAMPGVGSGAPMPWLVTFNSLPAPPNGFDAQGNPLGSGNTPLSIGTAPAFMRFTINPNYSALFPEGGIFIPARNDDYEDAEIVIPENYLVKFGPISPTVLPIYEVAERPDDQTVLVQYNGYYPMRGDRTPLSASSAGLWPVWVIPPAFEERDSDGDPLLEDKSPVLKVHRFFINLPEIE